MFPIRVYILWTEWEVDATPLELYERVLYSIPIGSSIRVNIDGVLPSALTGVLANNPFVLNVDLIPRDNEIKHLIPFRYLVFLDFEATCDYGPEPRVLKDTSEIIEFPWTVVDLETQEIIYEKQLYVRPDDLESLTIYCTKLTGITQDTVKDGLPLREALQIVSMNPSTATYVSLMSMSPSNSESAIL